MCVCVRVRAGGSEFDSPRGCLGILAWVIMGKYGVYVCLYKKKKKEIEKEREATQEKMKRDFYNLLSKPSSMIMSTIKLVEA